MSKLSVTPGGRGDHRDVIPARSGRDLVRDRIAQLEDRIAELERAQLAISNERQREMADDRALVEAIAASVGVSVLFSARELVEHAVIDPALSNALDNLSVRQLGKRLRAIATRKPSQIR